LDGQDGIRIIGEPVARNTAPGIGLAAVHLQKEYGDTAMVVLPADHVVADVQVFHEVLGKAVSVAAEGHIVTLGIVPDRPETGYGYIEQGQALSDKGCYNVKHFVEKPSHEVAQQYLVSGNYLWNSGMFVFKVSTILEEIETHLPKLNAGLLKISDHIGCADYDSVLQEVFEGLESVSIDYGVMEKSNRIVVIPADMGWDDVGSWLAVGRLNEGDEHGNVLRGDAIVHNSQGNILDSDGKRLVVLGGVQDLVVVDCDDVLLVCHKDSIPDMRSVVSLVRNAKGGRYL
jgi:mannose-1-phosphate guanylyltransferase